MAVARAGQVVLRWNYGGQAGANVFGLDMGITGTVGTSTANDVAGVVTTAFGTTNFAAALDSGTILTSVSVRDLRTDSLPEFLATTFTPLPGTGAAERVSLAHSAVVTLRTAKAGRRFRGRLFIGGLSGTAVDDETATIQTTSYTACVGFVEAIRTGLAALGGQPFLLAVVSQPDPNATPPWPGETNVVTAVIGRSAIVGSQRRRLPARP